MKYEDIDKIIQVNHPARRVIKINFKTRSAINGIFIKASDYNELSRKNLWRIVREKNIEAYIKSSDDTLVSIFNGSEITRLTPQ